MRDKESVFVPSKKPLKGFNSTDPRLRTLWLVVIGRVRVHENKCRKTGEKTITFSKLEMMGETFQCVSMFVYLYL